MHGIPAEVAMSHDDADSVSSESVSEDTDDGNVEKEITKLGVEVSPGENDMFWNVRGANIKTSHEVNDDTVTDTESNGNHKKKKRETKLIARGEGNRGPCKFCSFPSETLSLSFVTHWDNKG